MLSPRKPNYVHLVAITLLGLTLLEAVLLMRAHWPLSIDDAFISLRYARHWVEGHGIVWNRGENPPVEGYSNFSFVVIGAAALKAGLSPILALKLVGAASLLGTCILLFVLSRRWLGPVGSTIPAILFINYRGTVYWSVSGLETTFYVFLAVASVTCLILGLGYRATPIDGSNEPSPSLQQSPISVRLLATSGFLAFIAALTRPEGPALFLVLVATAALFFARRHAECKDGSSRFWPAFGVLTASFALPYSLYFGWRLLYFGRLMPNPVTCKTSYMGDPFVLTGAFLAVAWPFLLLAVAHRRVDVRHIALLGLTVIYSLALIGADPVIGHFNRHFLAAFGLLLVLAGSGLVNVLGLIPRITRPRAELMGALLVGALAASQFGSLHEFFQKDSRFYARRMQARQNLGETVNKLLRKNETYVHGDAGIAPFVSHPHVIDAFCLNNREFTEPPISFSVTRFVDDVLESKKPEAIVLLSSRADRLVPWEMYSATMSEDERFKVDYRPVLKFANDDDVINSFLYLREDIADERIARLLEQDRDMWQREASTPLRN